MKHDFSIKNVYTDKLDVKLINQTILIIERLK